MFANLLRLNGEIKNEFLYNKKLREKKNKGGEKKKPHPLRVVVGTITSPDALSGRPGLDIRKETLWGGVGSMLRGINHAASRKIRLTGSKKTFLGADLGKGGVME